MRTIIDLREEDELDGAGPRDEVETIHIPLDRIADDPEFWDDWMHGPQFGTPLYYAPFVERFPERIERCSTRSSRRRPAACCSTAWAGATAPGWWRSRRSRRPASSPRRSPDDYARGAERAHTHDPAWSEYLAERGTSARELVLAAGGRASTTSGRRLRERLLV